MPARFLVRMARSACAARAVCFCRARAAAAAPGFRCRARSGLCAPAYVNRYTRLLPRCRVAAVPLFILPRARFSLRLCRCCCCCFSCLVRRRISVPAILPAASPRARACARAVPLPSLWRRFMRRCRATLLARRLQQRHLRCSMLTPPYRRAHALARRNACFAIWRFVTRARCIPRRSRRIRGSSSRFAVYVPRSAARAAKTQQRHSPLWRAQRACRHYTCTCSAVPRARARAVLPRGI